MSQPTMPRDPLPLEPGHTVASGLAFFAFATFMPSPALYALGVMSLVLVVLGLREGIRGGSFWHYGPRPHRVLARVDRERRRRERAAQKG